MTPKTCFGLAAIEKNVADATVLGQKAVKIVWFFGVPLNGGIQATLTLASAKDIPHGNMVLPQLLCALRVRQFCGKPKQFAHDRPEGVAWVGIVLTGLE